MAINIDPVVINDGDPVSAEVIQRMNSNIAKVALGEKITVINITNTTGTSTLKSANTTIHSYFPAKAEPKKAVPYTVEYGNITFTDIPSVALQIENPNAGVKSLHEVYLTECTKIGFKCLLIPSSLMTAGSDGLTVRWIAVGNVDNNTQA